MRPSRPAQQQRYAHRRLVGAVLLRQAVVAEHLAVIGRKQHYRVLLQPQLAQHRHDARDAVVDLADQAVVEAADAAHAVGIAVGAVEAGAVRPEGRGKVAYRAVGVLRQGHGGRIVQLVVRLAGRERRMRRDPGRPQEERLVGAVAGVPHAGTRRSGRRPSCWRCAQPARRWSAAGSIAGRGTPWGNAPARRRRAGSAGSRRRFGARRPPPW